MNQIEIVYIERLKNMDIDSLKKEQKEVRDSQTISGDIAYFMIKREIESREE